METFDRDEKQSVEVGFEADSNKENVYTPKNKQLCSFSAQQACEICVNFESFGSDAALAVSTLLACQLHARLAPMPVATVSRWPPASCIIARNTSADPAKLLGLSSEPSSVKLNS